MEVQKLIVTHFKSLEGIFRIPTNVGVFLKTWPRRIADEHPTPAMHGRTFFAAVYATRTRRITPVRFVAEHAPVHIFKCLK
jgi:hypothetical protein